MLKRLETVFHPAAIKIIDWDQEEVEKWGNASLNGLGEDFEQWDMQYFKEFRHAYATLMRALVTRQTRAIRLAAGISGHHQLDRKSVVSGTSVSVRVDLGGGRIMKKKIKIKK